MELSGEGAGYQAPSGDIRSKLVRPGDPGFESWIKQRRLFTGRMGWQLDSEHDHYDNNPLTHHVLVNDEYDALIVGMRLTPVETYEQGLSWQMLAPVPEMQDEVKAQSELDATQPVWDVTKLIKGTAIFSSEISHLAIGQLFGEGLRLSREQSVSDPTWVFVITTSLYKWLSSNGVRLHGLSEGRIQPTDRTTSIFGYVHTTQGVHDSQDSPIAARSVEVLSHE
jgi:N-acyl-L-homoserine lactone synthetase